ncbi:hypothetical protein F5144DRAFT_635096 [Chaetomium tenue]|uniref:Uncharacterized protein n=1 Tax=Chaetomium tenue TaxID=1854479 RepID=A0ACB7PJW5_9PEZI|nr:hypothetical protein F5144DRAFT_635096 [Chaetomium globosum]
MDFEIAAERVAEAFAIQERKLAKQLAVSEYLDLDNSEVYLRAPVQRLDKCLERAAILNTEKNKNPLRRVVLYCDTLEIPENIFVGNKTQASALDLRVFARKICCKGNPEKAIRMNFSEDAQLEFYTDSLLPGFAVEFEFPDGSRTTQALSIDQNKWGIQVNWIESENKFNIEQRAASTLDMSTADHLDRLTDAGTLKGPDHYINDNLPRLVYYQFLVAASSFHSSMPLYIQASSLRNGLMISNTLNAFHAPSVNIHASKQVLKSRLLAAKGFEDAFQRFAGQESLTVAMATQAADLLSKSENAMSEYKFLEKLSQQDYDNAVSANDSAQKRFVANKDKLSSLETDFKAGIEKWIFNKKIEASKETFFAGVGVIAAVVGAVATGGAAAPAIPAAADAAVNAASKMSRVIDALKGIYKRIKDLYDRLSPVIENLLKLYKAISGLIKAIQAPGQLGKATALQRPDMTRMDIFNATALWDIFGEEVRSMEKTLSDVDAEGKAPYFLALRTLVINGKTYLQTQENFCRRGNDLAVVLLRTNLQVKDSTRLKRSLTSIHEQEGVLDILKLAMFDRLLAIRSLVFVDFQTYVAAHMFHCLTLRPLVTLSPVKRVVDYFDDAAALQSSAAEFGSRVMVQQRRFTIHTLGDGTDIADLRNKLRTTGTINVTLDPSHEAFKGFCRIRLSKARCYLEGAKIGSSPRSTAHDATLRLYLRTPGRFYDIGLPRRAIPGNVEYSSYRAFVGDKRTLLFEYSPQDGSIACDGDYYTPRSLSTQQTPLTDWEVVIAPGGLRAKDMDLEGLTGLRMELWCDMTLLDS